MRCSSLLFPFVVAFVATTTHACVFAPDPAPCFDDDNCPDALACVASVCVVPGGGDEGEGEGNEGEGEGAEGEGEGEGEGECFEVAELIVRVDDDMDILTGRDCVTVAGTMDVSNFFGAPGDLDDLLVVINVGGDLVISSNNSFGDLSGFANIARVGGSLSIETNAVLNDVTGLSGTSVDGDVTIVANAVLQQCDAEALAAAIEENGLGGSATVENNLFDSCT